MYFRFWNIMRRFWDFTYLIENTNFYTVEKLDTLTLGVYREYARKL